jgi:hypothetical protein
MEVELLAPAHTELMEAVDYYNSQREGLGDEFAIEVERTIERIQEYPEAWPSLSRRTRRCRTNRFPYGIIYQARGDSILIVGVMHLRRDPDAWRSRLPRRER